jgi:hypothetical protein
VRAEEQIATARALEIAERQKNIDLVEAHKVAEREAIGITVAAEAQKKASQDRAEAGVSRPRARPTPRCCVSKPPAPATQRTPEGKGGR